MNPFNLPYETNDSHLYSTMIAESVSIETRLTIANQLLKNPDGMLRSKGYWFLVKQGIVSPGSQAISFK